MMDGRIRDTRPGPDGTSVNKHLSVSVTHVHRTAPHRAAADKPGHGAVPERRYAQLDRHRAS